MREDFYIASYQVSLFPKALNIPESKEFFTGLLELYNGKPTIFPSNSEGTPNEIPVVNLKSIDGTHACQIGKDKIWFSWLFNDGSNPLTVETILDMVDKVMTLISSTTPTIFTRVGFITTIAKTVSLPEKENVRLLEKSKLLLPRTSEMNQYQLKLSYDFSLNSHPNCFRVLDIVNGNKILEPEVNIVAVQQDLNTKPEEGLEMDLQKAKNIIKEAYSRSGLDEIFDLVWKD